jgi:hypothetical protein
VLGEIVASGADLEDVRTDAGETLRQTHTCHRALEPAAELDATETGTHSFVIKIWQEVTAEEGGSVIWRGHITHVPGGERRYLKELPDVDVFIKPYLTAMGVQLGVR